LKQSLTVPDINSPGESVEFIDKRLQEVLKYKEKQSFMCDGMDISFCVLTPAKKICVLLVLIMYFTLYEAIKPILQLKTDNHAVGQIKPEGFKYTTQTVELNSGDTIYLFTDGFADQFGRPKGKRFKRCKLENILINNSHLKLEEQKIKLENTFLNWKGYLEQVDDVFVMGIRV
jgi:serine phosphatase RsbU (regulator of sigma subunit)